MGWIRLKRILAAVLAGANLILLVCLISLYRSSRYLPAESLVQVTELLAENGIAVSEGALTRKKPQLSIWEGTLDGDYYTRTAENLSGSETNLSFNTPDGFIMTMENGDRFAFGAQFAFRYQSADAPESTDTDTEEMRELSPLSAAEERRVKRAVESFLNLAAPSVTAPGNVQLSLTVVSVGEAEESGICYCVCTQSARGTDAGFSATFAVYDGEVISASGTWCFTQLDSSYSAQLLDQINILYCVRSTLLEERTKSGADVTKIETLTLRYAVYFRSETEQFYLIPVWEAGLNDGTTYVFNALDGSEYTS